MRTKEEIRQANFERDDIICVGGDSELNHLSLQHPLDWVETIHEPLDEKDYRLLEQCGLTGVQMSCVYLRYFENLSEREVAESLGIIQSVVHRHIGRAKKKIEPILRHLVSFRQTFLD